MSGIFGGGASAAASEAPTTNLQVQTSANGNPLPIPYGTARFAPNLLWYGNFYYTASQSGGSGKGGVVGGGKGGQSSGYNYYASFQFGLCEGPINGIGAVWSNGNQQTAAFYGLTTSVGEYSQTPWTYLITNFGYLSETHTIPATGPYVVAVTYNTEFMIDNGVTGNISLVQTAGTPTSGQYSIQSIGINFTLTFPAAYAGAIVTLKNANFTGPFTVPSVAPYTINWNHGYAPQSVIVTNFVYTLASGAPASGQYFSDGLGNYTFNSAQHGDTVVISYASNSQSPAFSALGYSGVAWAGAPNYALGQSPSLQNFNFEIQGFFSTSVGSLPDADPSLVVADLLTNAKYGAGYPSGKIGDLTNYQNYTLSAGLLVSFILNTQTPANGILMDLAAVTNSAWAWTGGALNLVPYGDTNLSGNGKTYTAPSSPLYALGDSDFIRTKGTDPVQMDRKRPVDANNWLQMTFSNRDTQYNTDTVEYKNEVWINKFRLRTIPSSSLSNDYFADAAAAQTSINLQGQRQLVLNTFTFTLDQRYIVLDCMDIVSITDSGLGLTNQWVRITGITENPDFTLTIAAEEYLGGTGSTPSNAFPSNSGYATNFNVDPGSVNTPIIFAAPVQVATNTGLEVWMIVSGANISYGGCQVWASSDDENYKMVGMQINGNARQGFVTADGTAMDVDLSESDSQLLSGNPIDSDLANTLCVAIDTAGDFELFSYETALLQDMPFNYELSGLNRALYGTSTPGGFWPDGTAFGRLDSQTFIMPYNENQIGQDIYIKFLSFNIYGGGQQSLADVSPYIYMVQGPPLPPDVQDFSVQQNGSSVVFTWTAVFDFGLKGYDIRFAPQGTSSWDLFDPLTEATAGSEMTNAGVPPGTWTFAIRARDIANQLSETMAVHDLVVTNINDTVATAYQQPGWPGTLDGWGLHYTGVLYPLGTVSPASYATINPPLAPTLGQTSGGLIAATTYYVKITYVGEGTETTASPESFLLVLLDNLLTVMSPLSSGSAIGYNVYVSTSTGTETLQNNIPVQIGTDWVMPTSGIVTGIAPPTTNSTGWEVFDSYCPDAVTTAAYTAPTIDTGYNANLRVWFMQQITPGMGVMNSPIYQEFIDTWLTGETDPDDYNIWTIGTVTMRYLNARLTHTPDGAPAYLSNFTVIIDTTPQVETSSTVVVAPGGTAIVFPAQYHSPPFVQTTVVGSTALYSTAANITATGFTAHVFNSTGSDVGGTINWSSTGE